MKKTLIKSPEVTTKSKIFYIEFLRIIACFAVILLHSTNGILVNTAIYGTNTWNFANFISAITRFAVPIFLMISGFLSFSSNKDYDLKSFFKKKIFRLLLPLFIYSFVYYSYENIHNDFSILDFLHKFLLRDVHYHLWFMFTLIGIELFVPVLKKSIQSLNNKMLWYFLFIIIIPTSIAPFINKILGITIFNFEAFILGYFGYFLLGYILGKTEFSKKSRILIYLNGILWVFIAYFGNKILCSTETLDVFFNYGYQVNSYFIASAIFIFAKYNIKEFKSTFLNSLILGISRLSFDIYLIHALILSVLQIFSNSGHIVSLVLLSIPTFIISLIIAFIINKTKILLKKNSKNTFA